VTETGDSESSEAGVDAATQRQVIRERYARIATRTQTDSEGCRSSDGCCSDGGASAAVTGQTGTPTGDPADDLDSAPGGANLSLGCGDPTALAALSPGETVLDLGSGAGFDCLLAAQEVGGAGHVIGVDMTTEMVETARENARETESDHVEFRLGEIEHLPVADGAVDVVISNCVVNLSPNEPQVFREAYRVLRPGGRLAVTDVVSTAAIPAELRADPESVAACVAGASPVEQLRELLHEAGFRGVDIEPNADSDRCIREWDDGCDPSEFLVSATITGRKPAAIGGEP
jgi:SAM-dependent methyltransferase